jgi:hypothetical protein
LLLAGWKLLTSIVAYTGDAYVRSDLVALSPTTLSGSKTQSFRTGSSNLDEWKTVFIELVPTLACLNINGAGLSSP